MIRSSRNGHSDNGDWEEPRQWMIADPIPFGSRYPYLLSYAGWIREKNVRYSEAEHLMRKRWQCCAQPPDALYEMPWADAEEILRKVYRSYEPTTDTEPGPRSWAPVDLGPYLNGHVTRQEPTMGVARSDGLRLLYPGKEHTVIGEMESGKSWFACASCAAELMNGNQVLYLHFEEADPTDTLERLKVLGVPNGAILERFTFVGPDQPVTDEDLGSLLTPRPVLVVIDGVNEAMSLHRLAVREEDGAAAFRRLLVKPCTATGAATLAADHVVKDRDKRGRDPLGSVHKGNGLTGALILLENAEPFGRGLRGRSHVFVTKDRPGHLRRKGRPSRLPGKTYLGELVVDDTRTQRDYLDLAFFAPADHDTVEPDGPEAADRDAVKGAVAKLSAAGKPANIRNVRASLIGIGKDRIDTALTRLVLDGELIETEGPRRARLFTVALDQEQS